MTVNQLDEYDEVTGTSRLVDVSTTEGGEAEEVTLPGQRTRVILATGEDFTVQITNREYIAWDRTAPRKKWGSAKDVPFLASTFMAWTAAVREGMTNLPFDVPNAKGPAFIDVAVTVEAVEPEEDDTVRPTR